MYNLQLASCLAALKLQVNKFETQLYLDISTSFVIYVTRLLTDTIPYARDDIRILLSTLYAYVSSDGSFSCTILASSDITIVSLPDVNWKQFSICELVKFFPEIHCLM